MRVPTPFFVDVPRRHAGYSYGILSTYPPTACGLATFAAALARGLETNGSTARIVRVADGAPSSDPRIVAELQNDVPASLIEAIASLSDFDLAVVQHEYGLYGGVDGDDVIDILAGLTVPSIVVAHTVLLEPTAHQKSVLEAVAATASATVVMTEAARARLCRCFDVDPSKVTTISHGAAVSLPSRREHSKDPMLLTWGLLGRGKGIEWVIDAMANLSDLRPQPHYVVAGRTHPKVVAFEGEVYRDMLVERTRARGVFDSVTFDARYRDLDSLNRLIHESSIVVLPYDSRDQVTSGVLVDAIAAGRPVIATAFPHAVELLASGAGIVVPQGDASALAEALRRVLTNPELAASMADEAARLAPGLGWASVADDYIHLAELLITARQAVPA